MNDSSCLNQNSPKLTFKQSESVYNYNSLQFYLKKELILSGENCVIYNYIVEVEIFLSPS